MKSELNVLNRTHTDLAEEQNRSFDNGKSMRRIYIARSASLTAHRNIPQFAARVLKQASNRPQGMSRQCFAVYYGLVFQTGGVSKRCAATNLLWLVRAAQTGSAIRRASASSLTKRS